MEYKIRKDCTCTNNWFYTFQSGTWGPNMIWYEHLLPERYPVARPDICILHIIVVTCCERPADKGQISEWLNGWSFLIKSLIFIRYGYKILPEFNPNQEINLFEVRELVYHSSSFYFSFYLEVRKKSGQEVIWRLVLCYIIYHCDHFLHCCSSCVSE